MKQIIILILLIFKLFSLSHAETAQDKSIGLALSGGGARALAHIGVLKVIDEYGINIDYISGTSLGAFIGALYSTGWSAQQIEDLIINYDWAQIADDSIARNDLYIGEKRWKDYHNVSLNLDDNFKPVLPKGFINGHRLTNVLFSDFYQYSHYLDFNKLPIPFTAISTDLLSGELIIHDSGYLHEAIRASLTVPSIMAPFSVNDRLLIDGGVKMNFPSPIISQMGAHTVIGVKVTSDLRKIDQLTSPVTVFDQTLNISSLDQKRQAAMQTDILIIPELNEISSADFNKAKTIIRLGEEAARSKLIHLQSSDYNHRNNTFIQDNSILDDRLSFDQIDVIGNSHLSAAKVREYTKLTVSRPLSKDDILKGVEAAYRTGLFTTIYPVIDIDENNHYTLTLKVQEKNRNRIGFNIRYNEHNDITLGTVLQMKNYFGRNSQLLASLDLGGKREFLIDYVKNYGREWGAYFRLFPYINEHTIYYYDQQRNRTSTSKALETGATLGLGGFIGNTIVVEPYLFTFYKELYRDISHEDIAAHTFCTGIGVKAYHETIDDLIFPMKGNRLFLRIAHSNKNYLSELSYNKFHSKMETLIPVIINQNGTRNSIIEALSIGLSFEYGSYFGKDMIYFDPFYVGGIDSFIGLREDQMMIDPIVKIASLTTRTKLNNKLFIDLTLNAANLSDIDRWCINHETVFGGGVVLGFRTLLAPFRMGLGISDDINLTGYISIGNNFDPFFFSRK